MNTLETFSQVFKTLDEAERPPAFMYKSDVWFQKEKEAIFLKAWHFFCLYSSLNERGSYYSRTFVGVSVVVINGDDGKPRAFLNTCRHRGAPIVSTDKGKLKKFVCPFHCWTYSIDGELIHAPGMEFTKEDLKKCGHNLISIPCEVRENMIFICLTQKPPLGIDSFLLDYIENIAKPHSISSMRCVQHRTYEIQANWKLYVDVDMETLHTPFVHKKSIGRQGVTSISGRGQWLGVFNKSSQTAALAPGKKGYGLPFSPSAYGKGLEGTHFCIILPGFFIITAQDCMWWIQKTPISSTRTSVDVGYCFPEDVINTEEFQFKKINYFNRLDKVIKEDDDIVVFQQKGLNDQVPGCYTSQEAVVHKLDKWLINLTIGKGFNQEINP